MRLRISSDHLDAIWIHHFAFSSSPSTVPTFNLSFIFCAIGVVMVLLLLLLLLLAVAISLIYLQLWSVGNIVREIFGCFCSQNQGV